MLAQRPGRRASKCSPLLVFADPLDADREAACSTLLDGTSDAPPSLLVFAYNRRPRVVTEHVREHADSDCESLTILDLCEDDHRQSRPASLGSDVVVERESASNLTGIGIDVANAIDRVDEEPLHVCLGSLTTLVQYVDPETAFKFLQVTISRLESTEGHVHAHLDPDAVDEETVTTLESLFDGILCRRDREWTIED
ncbi:DUF7504 family protein [Halapricum salinum]|uniref:DUF7504 family protein n=1 Tax=Halapricum salinum TaxID=1457250 RepID=UPI0010A50B93|nr:hypothetical protein [Halapricum salinum]